MNLLLIVYIAGYLLTLRPVIRFFIEDFSYGSGIEPDDIFFAVLMGGIVSLLWPVFWPFLLLHRLLKPYLESYAERLNNER